MSDPGDMTKNPEPVDPNDATSAALNRRAFVGIGASVTALGGAIGTALAAGDDFGKPHPPIVPEDDPSILVVKETLNHDGRSLDAYAALPKREPAGAVVVVQAIWGVDAQLRDVVRRFAKAGYVAIAPNLYAGLDAPNGDNSGDFKPFSEVAAKLADATVDGDVLAAAKWARTPPPVLRLPPRMLKVGVTGFCMGGGITLRQTVDNPSAFAAAAMFYGKVRYSTNNNNNGPITPIALAYADYVKVPLLGSFGGRDTSILRDDVRALFLRLDGGRAFDGSEDQGGDHPQRVANSLKIYDEAGHAFMDDTRESYVASAATDAWARTLAWFAKYLSG